MQVSYLKMLQGHFLPNQFMIIPSTKLLQNNVYTGT
jgi:hypothetical protein